MNEWKRLLPPVVGPSAAHSDRQLDRAPWASNPLSRGIVTRKRTGLDLAEFLALAGKGQYGKRRTKAQMLAPKNAHRKAAARPEKRNDSRAALGPNPGPFSGPDSGPDSGAGFRPLLIIHIVGRNPAPESGPESGPQNGTAFGTILRQSRDQGRCTCNSISRPKTSHFVIQCG